MKRLAACLSLLLRLSAAFAIEPETQQAFPLPSMYNLVNDYYGMIPPTMQQRLLGKLRALEKHNGTQIVLMTVPSTGDEGVEAYSLRAFERWDIGNNGQGNGVLFLIDGRGPYYIRTGGGISGAMPDAWLHRLVRNTIEPRWNSDHYLEAIEAAIDAMIQRANGEETRQTLLNYDEFQPTWRHLTWGALGLSSLIYIAYIFGWRRFRRRPNAPIWLHVVVGLTVTGAAATLVLASDPLVQLLARPVASSRQGGVETLKLARHVLDLHSLSVRGSYTVLALIVPSIEEDSSLRQNLEDFSSLRPDVAIRIATLDFKDWNTGLLRQLYGQKIEMLPFFVIFDPAGHMVATDESTLRPATPLLNEWHSREAQRMAKAP